MYNSIKMNICNNFSNMDSAMRIEQVRIQIIPSLTILDLESAIIVISHDTVSNHM